MTEQGLAKIVRVNKVVMRLTWVFLTVGLIEHFIFDEWLASPIIPQVWFSSLMIVLWVLIVFVILGELTAYIAKRRVQQ